MRPSPRRAAILLALVAFLLGSVALSQDLQPVGKEFQASVPNDFKDLHPDAAFLQDGRSLVVWSNRALGILGRFFDDGTPYVANNVELVANSPVPSNPGSGDFLSRHHPAVVAHPSGDFFLFWTEEDSFVRLGFFQMTADVRDRDVFGQRFDRLGRVRSEPFRVNQTRDGFQSRPRAALVGDRLIVVWESTRDIHAAPDAVMARLLDLDGMPLGAELQVNVSALSEVPRPKVAVGGEGTALVVWAGLDGDRDGVFGRPFDSELEPLTDELQINSVSSLDQRSATVAAGKKGGFLVAWQQESVETGEYRIFGRALDDMGAPVAHEVRISPDIATGDGGAVLAACPNGNYLIAWVNWWRHAASGIAARELSPEGAPISEVHQLNDQKVQSQWRLGLAANPQGQLLVTWEGVVNRVRGISARLLEAPAALPSLRLP